MNARHSLAKTRAALVDALNALDDAGGDYDDTPDGAKLDVIAAAIDAAIKTLDGIAERDEAQR